MILGDGANGTLIASRGFDRTPYDQANLGAPDLVRDSHAAYYAAGSDFIETNTFMANRLRLEGLGLDVEAINRAGARLAREVAGDRVVLGAMGPAGRHLQPLGTTPADQLRESYVEQAIWLAEGGVDALILETFLDLDELVLAVDAVREATGLPVVASRAFIEDGEALAEGLPQRVAQVLHDLDVAAIGANCVVGPQRMVDIIRQVREVTDRPVLAFPTPGLPQLVRGQVVYDTEPEYFARAASRLVEAGATILGGCCGTRPEHIAALRRIIDKGDLKPAVRASVKHEVKERKPLPESPPTELRQKLGRKFVLSVEMDLPRGLNVAKVLAGSRQLKIAGADVVDISDGARARLRMNPLAASKLIQDQVGIEVVMHFACRDRNLLAIQADLLGAHAMGVRNILAITGDPANIGDYPSATSVFDVDAIGLVRIMSRFNEGVDLAGYSVGARCAFTIAVAYNPLAADADLELDRLMRKAEAGAHLVYTQPLYELAHMEATAEACGRAKLPFLAGVLPVRSSRHAEFMHHEVPGIEIPAALRKSMAEAATDEDALEIGIAASQRLVESTRLISQGLYLMPPFGSPVVAQRVMEALGSTPPPPIR